MGAYPAVIGEVESAKRKLSRASDPHKGRSEMARHTPAGVGQG
jgi:hypothetical protein